MKAKRHSIWTCGKCNTTHEKMEDAEKCCSSCVEAWQIWSSLDGAKVFVNEVDSQ
jgi:protein-arginine kinase activator protein McsA